MSGTPMKRWSCAIECDVIFPAADEDAAWERAEEIAQAMRARMEGRQAPGLRRRSTVVYHVELNTEPGAVLDMEY